MSAPQNPIEEYIRQEFEKNYVVHESLPVLETKRYGTGIKYHTDMVRLDNPAYIADLNNVIAGFGALSQEFWNLEIHEYKDDSTNTIEYNVWA